MKYTMYPRFLLRGWKGHTNILQDSVDLSAYNLTEEEMELLKKCNGENELEDSPLLLDALSKGIIHPGTQFNLDQSYRYYDFNFAHSAQWAITGGCNLKCIHCSMESPTGKYTDLSLYEHQRIADQLYDCGIREVTLTGGEPLSYSYLYELMEYLRDVGIKLQMISTNGTLVDESALNAINKCGHVPTFSISLDGIGFHDHMRGVPGTEKKSIEAIKLLTSHGYKVGVTIVVCPENTDTIKNTIEYLNSIGVWEISVSWVGKLGMWKTDTIDTLGLLKIVLDHIPWYYALNTRPKIQFYDWLALYPDGNYSTSLIHNVSDPQNTILCGDQSVFISPDGKLLPCMGMNSFKYVKEKMPNILEVGLEKALNDSFYSQSMDKRVSELIKNNPECQSCEYVTCCGGGCRAQAMEDDPCNYMAINRRLCYVYKNGMIPKILESMRIHNPDGKLVVRKVPTALEDQLSPYMDQVAVIPKRKRTGSFGGYTGMVF